MEVAAGLLLLVFRDTLFEAPEDLVPDLVERVFRVFFDLRTAGLFVVFVFEFDLRTERVE